MEEVKHEKILLFDDNPVDRELTELMLKENGYLVVGFSHADSCLEELEKHKPDLVLLDIMMPGLDGNQVLKNLRLKYSQVELPVIMVTSKNDAADVIEALKNGANDFIVKPVHFAVALTRIKTQLTILEQSREMSKAKELEEMSKRLHQSEKLSSIGLLASGVAHEINNPNAYLKGNLEIVLEYLKRIRKLSAEPRLMECADEIETSIKSGINGSERISKITSALLHFSRQSSHSHQNLRLEDVLNDALTLTSYKTKRHRVEISLPPSLASIEGSPNELSQVFMNLVINAMDALDDKYSNGGGTLKINIEDDAVKRMQKISFADNGKGISKEDMRKIFDPFFTTKPMSKGTGLGLSISRGIIENHHGELSCESTPGEGARFDIALPWSSSKEVA